MVQTGSLLVSQGPRPLCYAPAAMACVPSPLTLRLHINRKLASSAAHFSSAAQEASISRQKAQQENANRMSPSFTTEASQPLPARSTVAQRKQANELRKVRRRQTTTQLFVLFLEMCSALTLSVQPSNSVEIIFCRLLNPCWRREDELASMTVSIIWRAWFCPLLAKITHATPSWKKRTFWKWQSASSEIFLPPQSKVSIISTTCIAHCCPPSF